MQENQECSRSTSPPAAQVGQARRGYRKKPLVVHPATYVPTNPQDEARAVSALAELLAPTFKEAARVRDSELGSSTTVT